MRIISQDGEFDIPYEQVVIQQYKEKIYFLNKNLIGVEQLVDDMEIASYSTESKAKMAMKMLHTEWDDFGNSGRFQFPADEDVED